jgi:NADH-quinone oxidoreductase E subunit
MSIKKISKVQPEIFEFNEENFQKAKNEIKKYPKNRKASAVMSLLFLAQKQNSNWIPLSAIKYIANLLSVSYIQVYEVATFYSMFNLTPVGKYFVQVCTTTPCMIRGAKKITDICKKKISKNQNQLSENKISTWVEVECLGACINAPMMQINDDYYENLEDKKVEVIFDAILSDSLEKPELLKVKKSKLLENNNSNLTEEKNA